MAYNETQLDKFLDKSDYRVVDGGEYTALDTFVEDFYAFLRAKGLDPVEWPRDRIKRDLDRGQHPVGPGAQNKMVVGNLTKERSVPRRFVKTSDGRIRLT